MVKISVVIPIYNADKTLKICVDSILNQSYTNLEIILVNDGSVDKSLQICNEYSSKYENIRVINKENQGVAMARNDGLSASTGDYIYFIDPDDWLESSCFEKNVHYLESNETDILIFGYRKEFIYKNERYYRITSSLNANINYCDVNRNDKLTSLFVAELGLPVWNKIFKKTFLEKNSLVFPLLKRGQDMAFCSDAIRMAKKIIVVEPSYYHYQDMGLTKTNKYDPNIFKNHSIIFDKLTSIFYDDKSMFVNNSYLVRMFLLWFAYAIPNHIINNPQGTFKSKLLTIRQIITSDYIRQRISLIHIENCQSLSLKVMYLLMKCRSSIIMYMFFKVASKINITYSNYKKEII